MSEFEDLKCLSPKKRSELESLICFLKAENIVYDGILIGEGGIEKKECPDFRLRIGSRVVGVEITMATRSIVGSRFTAHEIEAAQNKFARELEQSVQPSRPVIIHLSFNDGVPVDAKRVRESIPKIVGKIKELSCAMEQGTSILLVRNQSELARFPSSKILSEIPEFLRSIQLYRDGQCFSGVTCARGGIVERFTVGFLDPILDKKHEALKNYRECDEYWLVIISGMVPPILLPENRPKILRPSMAANFADADIARPIHSKFDRVYFFRCPTHALNLTEKP